MLQTLARHLNSSRQTRCHSCRAEPYDLIISTPQADRPLTIRVNSLKARRRDVAEVLPLVIELCDEATSQKAEAAGVPSLID